MITNPFNVHLLSEALEKFSVEVLKRRLKSPEFILIFKTILYYNYLSSRSTLSDNDINSLSENELLTSIEEDFFLKESDKVTLRSHIKQGFLNFFKKIFIFFVAIKFRRIQTVFIIKNKKFYYFIKDLIPNDRKVLFLLFEDDLVDELTGKPNILTLNFNSLQKFGPVHRNFEKDINYKYRYIFRQFFLADFLLRVIRPDSIISIEGAWHIDRLFAGRARALGIRNICVQRGWNPNINTVWKGLNFEYFLSWGKYFSQELQAFSPEVKFLELGTFHLDLKNETTKKAGIGFFLQIPCHMISDEIWQDFLNLIDESSKKFPTQTLIVREHPAHRLNEQERKQLLSNENIVISDPYKEDFFTQLSRLQVVVSIYSSCLLEAVVVNSIPISYNRTAMKRYNPDLETMGFGFEVNNKEDFFKRIIEIQNDSQIEEKISDIRELRFSNLFHSLGKESFNFYKQFIFEKK